MSTVCVCACVLSREGCMQGVRAMRAEEEGGGGSGGEALISEQLSAIWLCHSYSFEQICFSC